MIYPSNIHNAVEQFETEMTSTHAVHSNGEIQIQTISDGASHSVDKLFPLHTDFVMG